MATYIYNADDIDYFTTFTDTFTTSLANAGITDHFAKLQMLAYLIGGMKYEADERSDAQFVNIYEGKADCAECTFLFLALLNTSAFDTTRGGYIRCDLGDLGLHAVVGIDERDLGNPTDPGAIYWVEPSEKAKAAGIPDTRYAFLELTSPRDIGSFDEKLYQIHGVKGTTSLNTAPKYRDL